MNGTQQQDLTSKGYMGRQQHPDRQTTVILKGAFAGIQDVQACILKDGNLPKIDHGMLTSAAIELALEMDNAHEVIIQRALQITLNARRRIRKPG